VSGHRTFFGFVAIATLVACSSEERIDLAPSTSNGSSSSSTGSGAGGEGPTAKREVFVRNPIGGPTGNLLADGDFEMSIVSGFQAGGQYGWVAFDMSGATVPLLGETGGLCKSGLRCGRVEKNAILYARGTAAPGEVPHKASISVKALEAVPDSMASHPCGFVTAYVIQCDTFDIAKKLKAVANEPDANGWCELTGDVPASTSALCMYAENTLETLADAAYILPDPEASMATQAADVVSPEQHARMQMIRAIIRSRVTVTPESMPRDRRREAESE